MAIESVNTMNGRLAAIGVSAFDYSLDGKQIDLQDLLTSVSVNRANAVEDEMTPLSDMMRNRNLRLDKYGNLLAKLNKVDTSFKDEAKGSDTADPSAALTQNEIDILKEIGYPNVRSLPTKADTQMYLQAVKSAIDGLNNRSQSDITRLQSLVEKRDQTFTKAAELLKDVSDSRSKLITAYGG